MRLQKVLVEMTTEFLNDRMEKFCDDPKEIADAVSDFVLSLAPASYRIIVALEELYGPMARAGALYAIHLVNARDISWFISALVRATSDDFCGRQEALIRSDGRRYIGPTQETIKGTIALRAWMVQVGCDGDLPYEALIGLLTTWEFLRRCEE